ncbi:MAG: hypothetical protein JWN46_654 [Acidimicrobiales bacterium]|nr:hypothetical protein [Acidimicrobiales bacterium]
MSSFAAPSSVPFAAAEPGAATVGREVRLVIACLSAVVGVIHFAYAPTHWSDAAAFGGFFLAVGWLQFVWAGLVATRPSRLVLLGGIAVNVGVIAVWVVSRTAGLPFGPHSGAAEAVAYPDLLSTVLEGTVVLLAVTLLLRPTLSERPVPSLRAAASVTAGVAVVALAAGTMGISPSYVSAHTHGGAIGVAAGGHVHTGTAATATGGTGGTGGTAAAHTHAASSGPWAPGASPCEAAIGNGNPEGDVNVGANATQGHNHHGALPQQPVSPADRKVLVEQQKQARSVVARYPTVADATAAGYRLTTGYIPCIGAHYTNIGLVTQFDPAKPSELLYDGTDPTSKIIGLSYLIVYKNGPPVGFAGPNDVWHQHATNGGLCLNSAGVVIGGEQVSKATCEARGGYKAGLQDVWMVHDWAAPGWDCSWGVFAAECPELGADVRTS